MQHPLKAHNVSTLSMKLLSVNALGVNALSVITLVLLILLAAACASPETADQTSADSTSTEATAEKSALRVSDNGHFLQQADGEPFFWLGDTGWLLFSKLDRDQVETYLENRRQKGFNVVQVMMLHSLGAVNVYGDTALIDKDVSRPNVTEGSSFEDSAQYDYWDHIDYTVDRAAEKGIYMAMVPVWGSNVKAGGVSPKQAATYAEWLADRYGDRPNVIWLNGGDIRGDDSIQVWQTLGKNLREHDPHHLITFHPRGRTQSSLWFHDALWLDFNMFQSGHRRYDQDTIASEPFRYGEDNWRYVETEWNLKPTKPTIDGEPSYEGIPQGLHDPKEPLWNDADVRRYGYWAVFAGAAGYTYGNNSVMQMLGPHDKGSAYGATVLWDKALDDPGAGQMVYLKNLMLSRPYFDRVPDQSLIAGGTGEQYDRQIATRGETYAFIYTYNGKNIPVQLGKLKGDQVKATWYSPRDGKETEIGTFANEGTHAFDPPGEPKDGNDWVLILDSVEE